MGNCPFHNEKTPSFAVNQARQMYHCFGCGVGGNVFTFVMEYENFTFPEAIKHLADRYGISLPEQTYSEGAKRQADEKAVLMEIHKEAAKYFFYQLKSEQGGYAYQYFKDRGLSDEIIVRFGLGYSNKYSDDLYRYLKQKGYTDMQLKDSGLITIRDNQTVYDKFWNRAMFPIMDIHNHVIGFGGRVMGDGEPKYLNSPETKIFDKSRHLYGLNVARLSRQRQIILCEGYMDVIALHQAGFTNAAASLGTAFTGLQANLLKRYTDTVYLSYDSDGAGVKAALRAIPILRENGITCKVIDMKPYKDPDEFIKALGREEYQKRIEQAKNSFFFEVEVLEQEYNLNDPEEKTKFFNALAQKLLVFPEEIERNNYIEALDRLYHIGFDNLRKLVNQYGASVSMAPSGVDRQMLQKKEKKKEDALVQAQKLLLTWLIEEEELLDKLKDIIGAEDFRENPYHQVAEFIFFQYREQGHVVPAQIINHFESVEEQKEVASLFHTPLEENMNKKEKEKALNEIVLRIKKSSLAYEAAHATDVEQLQNIIKQQANLQKMHILL